MNLDKKTVHHIARLARLKFSEEELTAVQGDLQKIVNFCEKLDGVDTEGVEPLIYMSDRQNNVRNDSVQDSLDKEKALKNAPLADSDYFKIPKVIKK
jgi:aspartyl-tRNA(Asn)/glutamyl-tRNA(Gln) amidotransferase subunit C